MRASGTGAGGVERGGGRGIDDLGFGVGFGRANTIQTEAVAVTDRHARIALGS